LFNFFRNKKIRSIFRKFPNIDESERKWILYDLEIRMERLQSSLHLINSIERKYTEDRISLIADAIDIMMSCDYRYSNSNHVKVVREVYKPILK
jgi:hypothetical protein